MQIHAEYSKGIRVSRQLRAWTDSLQNSPITGPRNLTDQTKRAADQKQRAEAFLQKLKAARKMPAN